MQSKYSAIITGQINCLLLTFRKQFSKLFFKFRFVILHLFCKMKFVVQRHNFFFINLIYAIEKNSFRSKKRLRYIVFLLILVCYKVGLIITLHIIYSHLITANQNMVYGPWYTKATKLFTSYHVSGLLNNYTNFQIHYTLMTQ